MEWSVFFFSHITLLHSAQPLLLLLSFPTTTRSAIEFVQWFGVCALLFAFILQMHILSLYILYSYVGLVCFPKEAKLALGDRIDFMTV